MWGFKNKKEIEHPYSRKFASDSFVIHTMQDDIDEKFFKKTPKVIKKNIKSKSSPFLTKTTIENNVKNSLFSFKKKAKDEEAASVLMSHNNVKKEKTVTVPKISKSKIDLEIELDKEVKTDVNLNQEKDVSQNSNEKKESFFGERAIKDDYKIKAFQETKLDVDSLKQDAVKNVDNVIFEIEQDKKLAKKEILQEKSKKKTVYDAKKEYEDSLVSNNLPKFTNTSAPSFSYKSKNNKQLNDKIEYSNKKSSFSFMKVFTILFLIILGGVIGWLWFNGKSDMIENLLKRVGVEVEIPMRNPVTDVQIKIENESNENEEDDLKTYTYSSISPNYIKIQSTSTAITDFSNNLKEINKILKEENNYNLIQFTVTTEKNKELSFRAFSTMINLALPEAVFLNTGDDFIVYAYRSPSTLVTRFSIVINSLNEKVLKKVLEDFEIELMGGLKPLFLETLPSRSYITFDSSQYKSHHIRFFNFKDGTNKSIDYAIINNKLLLSTSMETMHLLIDEVFK